MFSRAAGIAALAFCAEGWYDKTKYAEGVRSAAPLRIQYRIKAAPGDRNWGNVGEKPRERVTVKLP